MVEFQVSLQYLWIVRFDKPIAAHWMKLPRFVVPLMPLMMERRLFKYYYGNACSKWKDQMLKLHRYGYFLLATELFRNFRTEGSNIPAVIGGRSDCPCTLSRPRWPVLCMIPFIFAFAPTVCLHSPYRYRLPTCTIIIIMNAVMRPLGNPRHAYVIVCCFILLFLYRVNKPTTEQAIHRHRRKFCNIFSYNNDRPTRPASIV